LWQLRILTKNLMKRNRSVPRRKTSKGDLKKIILSLDNLTTHITRVEEDIKGLRAEINELKTEVFLDIDRLKTDMSDEIKELRADMSEEISRLRTDVSDVKELLLTTNPKALIQQIAPRLVNESMLEEVKEGTVATWTFVKDTSGSFWAIGAAHCGFYHSGTLVTLPEAVCKLGVSVVYFPYELCKQVDFVEQKHDFILVQLKDPVPNYTSRVVWDTSKNIKPVQGSIVCGLSTSGYVYGDHVIWDNNEGVYVFIEDAGEPGHSGTLMFTFQNGSAYPFGVYYGIYSKEDKNMRVRAIIVPLHFNTLQRTIPSSLHQKTGKIPLTMYTKGQLVQKELNYTRKNGKKKKNRYVQYKEGDKHYCGVILQTPPILLCGALQCGEVKRHK